MNRVIVLSGVIAIGVIASAGACGSPVVGAACAEGYTRCGDRCVDLQSDLDHCGACDNPCEGGVCLDGRCADGRRDGGEGDMSLVDGSVGDGGSTDGGSTDGGPTDGGSTDAALDGSLPMCTCDVGERCCRGWCFRVDSDPDHCGACGTVCSSGEVCSAGTCRPACDGGLTLCMGRCVDLTSDANNCGRCANVCETGICVAGECAIGFPGHVILIGHDYRASRVGMNRVAGNAVFTAFRPNLRVAAYAGTADRMTVQGIDRAIDQVAAERGRSWTKTVTSAEDVPFQLGSSEVLLIYPQDGSSTDLELRSLGAQWTVALGTFTRRGGVVVTFDGAPSEPDTEHAGTWQVLAAAGLLDAGGRTEITGSEVILTDPSDSVALAVPLRYLAEETSVRFTAPGAAEEVLAHPDGPVVLHRTVVP